MDAETSDARFEEGIGEGRDVERRTLEPKYLTYVRDRQRAPSKLGDYIPILTLAIVF